MTFSQDKKRVNLIDNGYTIDVIQGERSGQLVLTKSFFIHEGIFYNLEYEQITISRESFIYPNYIEVYDKDGIYIGDIRIIKTFVRRIPMEVIIIRDERVGKIYKSSEFNSSRPIILYTNDKKSAYIRKYQNNRLSITTYDNINLSILIHIFMLLNMD